VTAREDQPQPVILHTADGGFIGTEFITTGLAGAGFAAA
jgi:hypothetical protein